MIRHLQQRLLSLLLHSPSHLPASHLPPLSSPRRFLSTAAPISPKPFAVEDYLVATCGLTRTQAQKASKKISHLKSPSKPDAVIAFLSDLGVPRSDITGLVAVDPLFLCASVEKNLAPRVAELGDLGLSRDQIARLVRLTRCSFRSSSLSRNIAFWLSAFGGSFETLLRALRNNSGLLGAHLDKVAKPNVALLRQLGLSACDFSSFVSRLLTAPPKHIQDAVVRIDELGVPQDSQMYRRALVAFALQTREKLARKIEVLGMLGWSKDDILMAVRKAPCMLTMSEERIRRNLEVLTGDVGLEIPYIAQRPVLVKYSLDRRLVPRHRLLKDLKAKGLLKHPDFYNAVSCTEKKFINKYVLPYKESVPGLDVAYFGTCAAKAPHGITV